MLPILARSSGSFGADFSLSSRDPACASAIFFICSGEGCSAMLAALLTEDPAAAVTGLVDCDPRTNQPPASPLRGRSPPSCTLDCWSTFRLLALWHWAWVYPPERLLFNCRLLVAEFRR